MAKFVLHVADLIVSMCADPCQHAEVYLEFFELLFLVFLGVGDPREYDGKVPFCMGRRWSVPCGPVRVTPSRSTSDLSSWRFRCFKGFVATPNTNL